MVEKGRFINYQGAVKKIISHFLGVSLKHGSHTWFYFSLMGENNQVGETAWNLGCGRVVTIPHKMYIAYSSY